MSDTYNIDFDLLDKAYSALSSNMPSDSEISGTFGNAATNLTPISQKHDNFLQAYLPHLEVGGGKTSEAATLKDINDRYKKLVNSLSQALGHRGADENGTVQSTGGSSGGGYVTGGSSGGSYSGGSSSGGGTHSGGGREIPDSSDSPRSNSGGSYSGSGGGGREIPDSSDSSRSNSGGSHSSSGGGTHVGGSISSGDALVAGGVASVGGSGVINTINEIIGNSSGTEYPLGNYKVNASFMNDLSKEELVDKLKGIGFSDDEINTILSGDYDVSKVLVDKISEKLAEAYKNNQGIKENLLNQYGFDIFNADGTVNNDRLSLALFMDNKSGTDNFSIISTLSSKYGINVVDQSLLNNYVKEFESMFMKNSDIRNKFIEKFGFDAFNSDGTINKDKMTLAMIIDEKAGGKYSIANFISDNKVKDVITSLGNDVTKIASNNNKNKTSVFPYIAGGAAVLGAVAGAGTYIAKKNNDKEKHKENRFIKNDLNSNENEEWVYDVINSDEDNSNDLSEI